MDYTFPVVGGRISSDYGSRSAPTAGASTHHNGIDIAIPSGSSVVSALAGVVKAAGYNSTDGNYIIVNHGNGLETVYKHLSKVITPTGGTTVSQGQKIGLSGNSGLSTGAHLHFEMRKDGKSVDPMTFNAFTNAFNLEGLFGGNGGLSENILDGIKSNWWLIAGALVVIAVLKR